MQGPELKVVYLLRASRLPYNQSPVLLLLSELSLPMGSSTAVISGEMIRVKGPEYIF